MTTTTAPAPANAKRPAVPGLAAACKKLGITAAEFRAAVADLDDQDRLDLTDDAYPVTPERRDAARQRCARGKYARRGGCNLMGVEFVA